MARILSVSYDASLLTTRRMILESKGHHVVSALGFTEALNCCQNARQYDLVILGHSIPHTDKQVLIATFRANCPAPVVALKRADEGPVNGADYETEPEPQMVVDLVEQISGKAVAAG